MAGGGFDWVTFLSDYGHDDVFVGVCKGVIAGLAPHVRILDVCHLVAPQDVEQGATALATAIPFMPVGVHLALVDPMQETAARGVVVATADGSMLVGPDNGLLSMAWDARGGATSAAEITNEALFRDTVHKTFRGRDVFADHRAPRQRPADGRRRPVGRRRVAEATGGARGGCRRRPRARRDPHCRPL